jgi:uncharacterized protein (DUF433 family)
MRGRISCDVKICSSKSCIKRTRNPVHIIFNLLAASENFKDIKRAYPNIIDNEKKAFISYAAFLFEIEAGVAV